MKKRVLPSVMAACALSLCLGFSPPGTQGSMGGVFETVGDNPHVSSDRTLGDVLSAHGGWRSIRGHSKSQKAVVTVEVYEKIRGKWRYVATGKATVKSIPPGKNFPSGFRATARAVCGGTEKTRWRSVVDVDLVGIADTADTSSGEEEVRCRV